VYAELTEPGRERVKALWRNAASGQQGLTRNLPESDLVQLRDICLRLIQAMNAEEAKTHATN